MKRHPFTQLQSRGFALVVTLSLMILLAVVAVGLLGLSAISMRTSSQAKAQAEAQANARLALMIAIGELQRQMGPDQRISANSAITSQTTIPHPHWTGVWDSWVAGASGTAPVNPNYPSAYNSAHQTLGSQADPLLRPNYQQKARHFRGWLLSLDTADVTNLFAPTGTTLAGKPLPEAGDNAAVLVGRGSLGSSGSTADFVSARLLNVGATSAKVNGRYAWWVGDESQKARITDDSYLTTPPANLAEKIFRTQAPASTGTSTIDGLENLTNDSQLAALPSLRSVDLAAGATGRPGQKNFHHITPYSSSVLADVREGGLKRDLSTILERPIDPAEVYELNFPGGPELGQRASDYKPDGKAFILYEFDSMREVSNLNTGQSAVPIQDLAAYYQLYDGYRKEWNIDRPTEGKGGIQYSSNHSTPSTNLLNNGIMVSNPDYGTSASDFSKFLRQYTALYRNPVPVKFEMIISYVAEPTDDTDKNAQIEAAAAEDPPRTLTLDQCDPYKLKLGLSPAITFWNPNNVPVVMNFDPGNVENYSLMMREDPIPLEITFTKSASDSEEGPPIPNATEGVESVSMRAVTNSSRGDLYTFFLSGKFPVMFEPGESKVFSLQFTSETGSADNRVDFLNAGGNLREDFDPNLELVSGWNPRRFVRSIQTRLTAMRQKQDAFLTFKPTDYIRAEIKSGNTNNRYDFTSAQKSRHGDKTATGAPETQWHFRSQNIGGRYKGAATYPNYANEMIYLGFPPEGRGTLANRSETSVKVLPRTGQQLVASMVDPANFTDDEPEAFLYYSIKAATETHESRNNTPYGAVSEGRRFPSRPFLHSPVMQQPIFDSLSGPSLYNYGWNWFFIGLNNMDEAMVPIAPNNSGYFGGGYSARNGATHIVQQHLPLAPPISIAALSDARLGGYSIATEPPFQGYSPGMTNPAASEGMRRVTAIGHAGLAPATLQAIGNSYAHPNIPPEKAVTTWEREYVEGTKTKMPFADHSYLANKALWDEFFFSSITPQPKDVKTFDQERTAKKVAEDFFFTNKPLPNRRMERFANGLDQSKLDALFTQSQSTAFTDGLADKIAAHLMVKGGFNVNSTSVDAWKSLFSSLKGKPVAYLDKENSLVSKSAASVAELPEDTPDGVPISAGAVPNARSYKGSQSNPGNPDQWIGWRELTEDEIEELAGAMVKQVKLRGPFLSLSEFVNRRLDSSAPDLAVKGALQAAIDDPDIPQEKAINGGFRSDNRRFTDDEKSFAEPVFSEAMDGAIAYGSPAYVDQADILRNLGEQITPRGDTFVIRTYGDSLDASGKVQARAWCEAVLQRTPEYVDTTNPPHLKQADPLLTSANKKYGRKFKIVSFRWLSSSEI